MAAVVAAITLSTLIGVGAERRWGGAVRTLTERLLSAVLFLVMPFVTFFVVTQLQFTTGLGVGLLYGHAAGLVTALTGYVVAAKVLKLAPASTGAVICAALLSNTGYLGLPLTVALLGSHQLGAAVAYDALVGAVLTAVVGFGVGAAFGDRAGTGAKARIRAYVLRNPMLLAMALGLIAPEALAPDAVVDVAKVVAVAVAPIGFFALGVNLMHEREDGTLDFPPPMTPALAVALALRLIVAPGIVVLGSLLLVRAPDAYLLEAAMPSAIGSLVIAHAYGLDLRLTSAAVAWSTAIVVVATTVVAIVT